MRRLWRRLRRAPARERTLILEFTNRAPLEYIYAWYEQIRSLVRNLTDLLPVPPPAHRPGDTGGQAIYHSARR